MRLNPFRKSAPQLSTKSANNTVQLDASRLIELRKQSEDAQARFRKHLDCIEPIERWYKLRDSNPKARANAIKACERQIAMSREAMAAWIEWGRLNNEIVTGRSAKRPSNSWGTPSHTGFTHLAIIREKDGEYAEALRLCRQAQKDGWKGDWDKRITRLEAKQTKAG